MPTTPGQNTPRGYPTPSLGEVPNAPQQVAELADAVDLDVQSIVDLGLASLVDGYGGTNVGSWFGGTPPADAQWKVRFGFFAGTVDTNGYARVTFTTPFPNGIVAIVAMQGDHGLGGDVRLASPGTFARTKEDFVFRHYDSTGAVSPSGASVRVPYLAIGW